MPLRQFGHMCSRMGIFLFAFLLFSQPLLCDDDVHDRCGLGERYRADRVHGIKQGTIQATRPERAFYADAPSGRFRVHYDTSGPHAVDPTDTDGNGQPDYIDECLAALEHAWRVEVDTLGYLPPPSDGMDGGSPALDVYINELGPSGYYGLATPDRLLRLTPTELWVSFLEIDNNYSALDSTSNRRPSYTTTGLDALRITCAHEFHHAIQNGSYAYLPQHRMLYELTSTWMEMRCWPNVRDWAYYASALLNQPSRWAFSRSNGPTGYVWGWLGNVLTTYPGDILRSTWERMGQSRQPYAALVEACSSSGTSFDDVFCTAVDALYRTGSRGTANLILPDAMLLPELASSSTITVSKSISTITEGLVPFEVRTYRLNLISQSGTKVDADAVISLNDERILANDALRERPIACTMVITPTPTAEDVPISATGWGARITPENHCFLVEGTALIDAQGAFPQPLNLTESNILYVPVSGIFRGEKVDISLLDIAMRPMQPIVTSEVIVEGLRVVAPIEVSRDIPPGTYLLFVKDRTNPPTMRKIFIQ